MAWTKIPDSDIDPDSPITTGLMTSYRENIIEAAPSGMIIDWPMATAPSGYITCNGALLSRTTYSVLFAAIGTTYGIGDGSTTFAVPDRRGEHVRGWANGSANDPDRASRTNRGDGTTGDNVGTKQGSMYASHAHTFTMAYNPFGGGGASYSSDGVSGAVGTSASGGNETRGRNVYTNYCIRFTGD